MCHKYLLRIKQNVFTFCDKKNIDYNPVNLEPQEICLNSMNVRVIQRLALSLFKGPRKAVELSEYFRTPKQYSTVFCVNV